MTLTTPATVVAATRGRLTSDLWASIEDTYDSILAHPFLTELITGELEPQAFAHYVVQDSHYLRDYARTLSVLAARSSDPAATAMFNRHAAGAVAVEQGMHEDFLRELGLADGTHASPVAPATLAYTTFLLSSVYSGSYAEALGAVLPCYWIYWQVGKELLGRSSPNPLYARWIETYGAEEFGQVVTDVLGLTDQLDATLAPDDRARMQNRFVTASRYEWMFWDAAYRREDWPL